MHKSIMKTIEAPVDRPSFADWFADIKKIKLNEPLRNCLEQMCKLRSMGANVQLFTSNNSLNEKEIHKGYFSKDN
ncbi:MULTISPECIES: hypothetical protein [unclassified Sphingobacterium]|uniref:hypothetical protein n=1 Tax=unclassified Sphingobacterium TaxID=2609468 RepID=UPI0025FED8A0|nr:MULTISPECIES: hypothetical protein [unclassified Sphingobacterium]